MFHTCTGQLLSEGQQFETVYKNGNRSDRHVFLSLIIAHLELDSALVTGKGFDTLMIENNR